MRKDWTHRITSVRIVLLLLVSRVFVSDETLKSCDLLIRCALIYRVSDYVVVCIDWENDTFQSHRYFTIRIRTLKIFFGAYLLFLYFINKFEYDGSGFDSVATFFTSQFLDDLFFKFVADFISAFLCIQMWFFFKKKNSVIFNRGFDHSCAISFKKKRFAFYSAVGEAETILSRVLNKISQDNF